MTDTDSDFCQRTDRLSSEGAPQDGNNANFMSKQVSPGKETQHPL